jgi:hypothetical protein
MLFFAVSGRRYEALTVFDWSTGLGQPDDEQRREG